jgi:TRL-like protein family
MKKIIISSTVLLIALASCTRSVTVPYTVTDNAIGTKVGSVKAKCILGFCGNINVGSAAAAKNGNITKIATVDYKITSKMFTTTYETIVTGE